MPEATKPAETKERSLSRSLPVFLVASMPVSAGREIAARGRHAWRSGAQKEAPRLAVKIVRQTDLQTARTIESAIALGFDLQEAVRIAGKASPKSPAGISRQVAVGLAPQTGSETGPKFDPEKPFGVALSTTPGTVLGTVPSPVRGASIPACFLQAVSLRCESTKRYAKTPKRDEDS